MFWSLAWKEKKSVSSASLPLQYHSITYGEFAIENSFESNRIILSCANLGNNDILVYKFENVFYL